jgi:hypothetical protein
MKLTELLTESDILNEKPMGFLKKTGLGLASKFSSRAAGKLATGKESNELKKDFDFYLGSTNQEPTTQSLMQFLNKEGLPTKKAQELISKIPGVGRKTNVALPKNVVDQIMTATVAGQNIPANAQQPAPVRQSSGAVGPSGTRNQRQAATPAVQTQAPASNAPNVKQLKSMVSSMSDRDKQELIDHLKKNDRYQKLRF